MVKPTRDLILSAWSNELQNDFDKEFLLHGIEFGFDIIDTSDIPLNIQAKNHPSASPSGPLYRKAHAQVLIEIENSTQAVYQHTADARAERATLLWYTIQLAFQENEDGDWLPYFDGAIYEERLENLYDKEEEEEDEFDFMVTDKFMKAVSYWFYSQSVKQDEIDKFVNMNNER